MTYRLVLVLCWDFCCIFHISIEATGHLKCILPAVDTYIVFLVMEIINVHIKYVFSLLYTYIASWYVFIINSAMNPKLHSFNSIEHAIFTKQLEAN